MPPLEPFKLERYFALHEFSVKYLMSSSDPESWSVRDILALEPGSEAGYLDQRLGYTESNGAPALRAEVARLYQSVDPAQIHMFAGAEEAIYLFVQATLGPGDHMIALSPCYQSHVEVARAAGAEVSLWRAREAHGWQPDPDELARLIRPNTRVIVINSPHNPTGACLARATFDALNALAQRHGIVVFSDEVFRESELDPAQRLPAWCDVNPLGVSLGVTSKSYGLPGLRIGWLATRNDALRHRIAALKDYTTICNSAPSEFLATIAMRHREVLARRTVGLLRDNLAKLSAFMDRHADTFAWVPPAGSPMCFPKYLRGDVDDFAARCVRACGVLLLPGSVYDERDNHFRLGFGRANFGEALAVFERWLTH